MSSNKYGYDEIIRYVVLDEAIEGLRSHNGGIIQSLKKQGFHSDTSQKLIGSLIQIFSALKSELVFPYSAPLSSGVFSFLGLLRIMQQCLEHYPDKKTTLKLLTKLLEAFSSANTLNSIKAEYKELGGEVNNIDRLNEFAASINLALKDIWPERESLFHIKLLEGSKITAYGRDIKGKNIRRDKISPIKWGELHFKQPDKAVFSSSVIYDGLQFSLSNVVRHKGRESRIPNAKAVIIATMQDRFASNSHCKRKRDEARALRILFPQYSLAAIERYISADYQKLKKIQK